VAVAILELAGLGPAVESDGYETRVAFTSDAIAVGNAYSVVATICDGASGRTAGEAYGGESVVAIAYRGTSSQYTGAVA
jgi:hypothetical protein